MPITTWIRDILGIRKDYVETEKTVLEIEKLEAERDRQVTPATFEDVKKYDPKYQEIELKAQQTRLREHTEIFYYSRRSNFWVLLAVAVIIALIYLLFQRFC